MATPNQRHGASGDARDPVEERHATDELADQCARLEEELEALRARYDMYFLGVERREPNRDRDEMKRRVERLKGSFTRNTGLKFRMQSLHARFISYERMWVRNARAREEGTYRKDILKARRHLQDRKPPSESSAAPRPEPASPAGAAPSPAAEPPALSPPPRPPAEPVAVAAASPPPRPGTAPPAASAPRPPAPAMGEPQLRALYDAYVQAKRRCNEDVSRITYEAMARTVQKQVPELMQRYKARSVEFKVVIQDGKALLKAVPKT
ncbi:MAG TPA: MXAN_5187 C-terminal domain-containing protein [Anaeromyxobacteraceae bacterium]